MSPKGNQSANPKRNKANARERNRMHGLNHALDELRRHIPLSSWNLNSSFPIINYHHTMMMTTATTTSSSYRTNHHHHQTKLSKIETLRLARNYLILLTEIVHYHQCYNRLLTGQILAYGLGQQSLNQLATLLNIDGSIRSLSEPCRQVQAIFAKYSII